MTEKVLIACVYYDNGETWEDHYSRNDILGVCKSFQDLDEAFDKHIETLGNRYRLARPDKSTPFSGCLGSEDPTEFYFYAMYKAVKGSQAYDESIYIYYYLVKEVKSAKKI